MSGNEVDLALSWLSDDVADRLSRGMPLVVFGAENHIEGKRFKSNDMRVAFKRLRNRVPSLRVTRLVALDDSDPIRKAKELRSFLDGIRSGHPQIMFVDDPFEVYSTNSCMALDPSIEVGKTLIADQIRSIVMTDTMHVDLTEPQHPIVSNGLPPMTPIEHKLYGAMLDIGLEVSCQVGFEPYVVDFLVTSNGERVIVEADGAGFHDADADRIRDERIEERHGLGTLRFTGSAIHANAARCAEDVKRTLTSEPSRSDEYPHEGLGMLDTSQRAAVEHSEGDVRVLAPAGSGKTKVLVNRVIWLLNRGVDPSRIMVLAFNRKAASQLEERLRVLGVPTGRGRDDDVGVWVATLNSFGNRVLLNEGVTAQLLDQPWKERDVVVEALHAIGERLVGMRGEDPVSTLTREIARIRRGLRSPDEVEVDVPQPGGRRSIAIDVLWSAVRDIQNRKGLITFDDQIYLATDLLLKDPTIRHIWQARFRCVLVDEYQDLNDAQITLMRILTSGPANIFAVGDDDQVIYSWRDANVNNLLEGFADAYPSVTDHLLEINYRCAKPIVRSSQRLISRNKRRHPKSIRPSDDAPEGRMSIASAEGTMPLGEDLVTFLKAQREENGEEWNEMAVLTRTNVQLLAAAVALDRAEIPRSPLPRLRLYSTHAAKRLLAYLSIVSAGSIDVLGEDLAEIINRPNRFVKNVDVDRIRNSKHPWIVLNLLAYGCPGTIRANDELRKFLKGLLELFEINAKDTCRPVDIVEGILGRFKFATERDESTRTADDATDEIILHVIREEARAHLHLEDYIEHMIYRAKEEMGEIEPEDVPDPKSRDDGKVENEVTLSTIHGAKGREWPTVCLFDVSRTDSNAKRSDADQEEERRVFYVGMTRAALSLHFTFVRGRPTPSWVKSSFQTH